MLASWTRFKLMLPVSTLSCTDLINVRKGIFNQLSAPLLIRVYRVLDCEGAILVLLLNGQHMVVRPHTWAQTRLQCFLGIKTALNLHLPPFEKRNPEHLFYTFLIHDIYVIYRSCKYPPGLWKEWVLATHECPEKSVGAVWVRRSWLE